VGFRPIRKQPLDTKLLGIFALVGRWIGLWSKKETIFGQFWLEIGLWLLFLDEGVFVAVQDEP
jgi:hypothetical protein